MGVCNYLAWRVHGLANVRIGALCTLCEHTNGCNVATPSLVSGLSAVVRSMYVFSIKTLSSAPLWGRLRCRLLVGRHESVCACVQIFGVTVGEGE